jgi:hypothetical protein
VTAADEVAELLARGRALLSEIRPDLCETLFIDDGRVQYNASTSPEERPFPIALARSHESLSGCPASAGRASSAVIHVLATTIDECGRGTPIDRATSHQ